jgi:ABC-type dipeptide/oligopeptide/nickel transport system permease component
VTFSMVGANLLVDAINVMIDPKIRSSK